MSLINDALKKAQAAQQQASPPPGEGLHFRPAEEEQYARHSLGVLLPVVLAVVALLVLFFVWRLAQTHSPAIPVRASSPTPAFATPPAGPSTTAAVAPILPAPPQPASPPVPASVTKATSDSKPAPTTNLVAVETNSVSTNAVPPADTPPKPAPLKLQGIVFNPQRPSALINGRPVFIGDRVGEFRVLAINQESATLVGAGQTNILTLAQ